MGYWTYYLAWFALAYLLRYPWLLAGVLVFFALRRFIPDPVVWLGTMGRIRRLRGDVEANPANARARRDLARIYLQRRRPRGALRLLDEALRRVPDDAELLYLAGLARLRSGEPEGALAPLVRAVELDPRVGFGEPYLVAAEALQRLGRLEEAEDALLRYVDRNSSSVQALTRLALVRSRRNDRQGAREALGEALATWSQVPRFKRRSELGWWLRAQIARVFL